MVSVLAISPRSAYAQRGNQSDVSGNIVTTSDIAGGIFQTQGSGENAQFRSPLVAAAVTQVVGQLVNQLQSGELSPPSTGLSQGTSLAGFQAAQQAIATLTPLANLDPATQDALATATTPAEVQAILASTSLSPTQIAQITQGINQIQALLTQSGLASNLPNVTTIATEIAIDISTIVASGTISPVQLQRAVAAYNTLVKSANLSFLENPPPEFQVVQKALETLVEQALEAQASEEVAANESEDNRSLSSTEESAMVAAFAPSFSAVEQSLTGDFVDHLGLPEPAELSLSETRDRLSSIYQFTGQKPATSYMTFVDPGSSNVGSAWEDNRLAKTPLAQPLVKMAKSLWPSALQAQSSQDPVLQIMLVTPSGDRMIQHTVEGVTRKRLFDEIRAFRSDILSPVGRTRDLYLDHAQQLYDWLVRPIEADLEAQDIDTLVFSTDIGLRFIPLAALHDGEQFLVENYSVALMPSFSLTDTRYTDLRSDQVLAMGASEFSDQPPLPAASVEISTIAQTLWQGESFINEEFTLDNLTRQSQTDRFRIIHLATHAAFQPGQPGDSYIQLWDTRLGLDQLSQLNWGDNPTVDLVVLSACQTAVGSREAELGFAGFAVQSGAKSALASIWSVNDSGTLGLMTEFYQQLRQQPIKAEALRQAQLAMLNGTVRYEAGQLRWTDGTTDLPPNLTEVDYNLSHPYYWAGFTMIGSAW